MKTVDATECKRAMQAAVEAGRQIASDFSNFNRRDRLRVVSTFRRQLIPPRAPGRRRSNRITAAHADWKAGMPNVALYRKHIPGWERRNPYRRNVESRALMDAIRTRERREIKRGQYADTTSV